MPRNTNAIDDEQEQLEAPDFPDEDENGLDDSDDADDIIDLENVEDVKFVPLPPATYPAIVTGCEYGFSQKSNAMLTWKFEVDDPNNEGKKRTVFFTTSLVPEALFRLKQVMKRVAPDVDLKTFKPKEANSYVMGRECQLKIKTKWYNGRKTNQVQEVLAPAASDGFMS